MPYPDAAWEQAMKVEEVMLKALSGEIHWFRAADILGFSLRTLRRWRERYESPDSTFSLGYTREYVTINTNGPLAFGGQHPVWRGRMLEGCMLFELTWDNVQSVLGKFYDGRQPAECFAGLYGSFAPYPRKKRRGRTRRQRRSSR